ncbi:hypothetical protein LOTGIDRAFT_157316 [Lottia gigantea]|uniref:Peptide-O-fucosyltransferase n=1 Tax=Lottia gigantea TaxID=225164 RepID=V4B8N4_LOTGI|nr:hypothetical protein LOTGIDRAFT_157316 [Lottia gigantea]ESP02162.1 hypothetical protein LOTGIDRAFT_157316 [Lottia gigantea]
MQLSFVWRYTMANTKRWCWYIPIVSLICTVIWYSYTMESTSRNRVAITALKPRVIDDTKQNVVAILSKQNVVPTVSKLEKKNEKYLVYLCDEKRDCGGWGDRQRGIVSLFLLSLVWKRTFKILISSPCDIKPYYTPTKEYNWIFTDDELKGLKDQKTKTLDFVGVDEPLMNMNMNSSEIADVLYIKTNCVNFLIIALKYANFLPVYLRKKGRASIFRESWNRFMIPTDKLLSQVVKIDSRGEINSDAKKLGKELVCAHLRIGHSKYLPNDYVGFPLVAVPKVWNFIDDNFHKKSRIFVATDNLDVRKSAISKYGRRYIGSYAYTMNPDNMRSNLTLACSSQESAYVDQLMLSKCDVLIFYRRSGFSIHASYLKTEWTNIYSILRNGSSTFSLQKTNIY